MEKICSLCGKYNASEWYEEYINMEGKYICDSCVESLEDNENKTVFVQYHPNCCSGFDNVVKTIENKDDFNILYEWIREDDDADYFYCYKEWDTTCINIFMVDIANEYYFVIGSIYHPKKENILFEEMPLYIKEWRK